MLTETDLPSARHDEPTAIRVALLTTVTDFGGIERVVLMLLRHMGPGIELYPLLFTRRDADQRTFFEQLEKLGAPHATFINPRKRRYVNMIRNIRDALAVFRGGRFDVVHTHGYRADLLGLAVSKLFGIPAVATVHGFTPNDRHLRLYERLDVALLHRFVRVISVSTRMKDDLVARGLDPSRVEVITNAISETDAVDCSNGRREIRRRLGVVDADFVFGYVGRLSEEKGLNHFLDALRQVHVNGGCGCAILVGDGPQRTRLEDTARALGLAERVKFVGFQSDVTSWYAAMDAFVLPSLTEGTPMALLEAMANGLPVIASAVGGVPAVVTDGENGVLVPPADPRRLSDAMCAVAGDPELRRRLSERGRLAVQQHFSVGTWIQKVRAVYFAAVAQSREVPA